MSRGTPPPLARGAVLPLLTGDDRFQLEESLCLAMARQSSRRLALVGMEWSPATKQSSYAAYYLTARFEQGHKLEVFVKDFGLRLRGFKGSIRQQREWQVYRDILEPRQISSPRFYGVVKDESRERFWLLLERVQGRKLSRENAEDMILAVRWLARMQAACRGLDASRGVGEILERHDRAAFEKLVQHVRQPLARSYPDWDRRLRLIDSLPASTTRLMANHPRVLAHGSFKPSHIHFVDGKEGPGLCVLDWERAAWSSPVWDLARLGFRNKRSRQSIQATYLEEVRRLGLALPPAREVPILVEHFELYEWLRKLATSLRRHAAPAIIESQVAKIEQRLTNEVVGC